MKRADDTPLDPELEAYLELVDATLAGEAVDPRHAELAELTLLVAAERPRPTHEFSAELDARVRRRFAPPPLDQDVPRRPSTRPHRWGWLAGASAAGAVAAALLVVILGGQRDSSSFTESTSSTSAPVASSGAAASPSAAASAPSSAASTAGGLPSALAPNGRKVTQSADLALVSRPDRIDAVAQEVFDVVGQAGGIVDQSSVTQTGGSDGSASFQLRLPSSTLGQTMGRLSTLPGSQVLSRTDNSTDVNNRYVSATRALADARALRTALLKQLANASTTAEIDSLKARINDAEASIASDQASLSALNAQINLSRVTVSITPRAVAVPVSHGGGFTLGGAAHVAGRVLVVAAGVGLIALAGLVPVGLVAALLAWIGVTLTRRRRERALDLA